MDKFFKALLSIGIFILGVWLLTKILPFLISLVVFIVLVLGIIYLIKKINRDNKKKK